MLTLSKVKSLVDAFSLCSDLEYRSPSLGWGRGELRVPVHRKYDQVARCSIARPRRL